MESSGKEISVSVGLVVPQVVNGEVAEEISALSIRLLIIIASISECEKASCLYTITRFTANHHSSETFTIYSVENHQINTAVILYEEKYL